MCAPQYGGISSETYESLDDKFHAPTIASSSEFHGSSKLPFPSKSSLPLFNRELSLTDVHTSFVDDLVKFSGEKFSRNSIYIYVFYIYTYFLPPSPF